MHVSGCIITFLVICGLMKESLQWEPQLLPCKTGHGEDGSCLARASCKAGSSGVDTSLYEPKGYKKIFLVICGLMKEGLQLLPCKTGHGEDGSCLTRAYCKAGSSAVDTSLYEPKGYKKICSAGEVCCLFSNIIPQTTDPDKDNDKDNFNFDDDDN